MSDRIRLITRADDAGSFRSANLAIRHATELGICRNAGIMSPTPFIEHAYELLGSVKGLCLGLHVTMTCEWETPRWGPVLPAQKVPALVEADGTMKRNGDALHQAEAPVEQLMAETVAQLELARKIGFNIEYIDYHMGVDWLPGYGEALEDLARREGLIGGSRRRDRLPKIEAEGMDHAQRLIAQLRAAEPGTYMAVAHPCFDDAETRAVIGAGHHGTVGADRDSQRRMFADPAVLAACEELGVEPVRFTDL